MNNWFLAVSAAVAFAALASVSYPDLAEYAEYSTNRAPYHPLATAEPAFPPRLIEPLMDRPVIEPPMLTEHGYSLAVYDPADGSVTLTYDDTYVGSMMLHPSIPQPSGMYHTQTYQINQTFAYACVEYDGYNKMGLYQYRGAGSFHGVPTLKFVRFAVEVPDTVPCTFPDYIRHTVDVYDASWFDDAYDLEPYRGPPEGATDREKSYMLPVRHMVGTYMVAVEPTSLEGDGLAAQHLLQAADIRINPDGTLTAIHALPEKWDPATRELTWTLGTELERTYEPGQSFVTHCEEKENTSDLRVVQYRGIEEDLYGQGQTLPVFAYFDGYTKVPIPCSYPDYIADLVDVVDVDALGRHYDMEYYKPRAGR